MDSWGVKAVTTIAAKLQRTVQSVKIRASRLQLGPALMAGEYITFNQLSAAFGNLEDGSCGYKMKSWVEKRGFPVHTKRVVDSSFRVVYLNEFWEWAEKNRSFLDFSRMEPLALGKEPPWNAGPCEKSRPRENMPSSMRGDESKGGLWQNFTQNRIKKHFSAFLTSSAVLGTPGRSGLISS